MKFLIDMNIASRWAVFLANVGVEAVHWSSLGRHNAMDAEIMTYARQTDSVVLRQDMNFSSILAATGGTKPSVVQLRSFDISPETIGVRTVAAIRQMTPELAAGTLLTIERPRIRLRLLPMSSGRSVARV